LYSTTNRGISWTRITTNLKAVGSCTLHPSNADEIYVATEDQGLWYSANRKSATPTFTQLNYPFRFPSRIFFNPYDWNEVWVTSFGNGIRLGRIVEPRPVLAFQRTNSTSSITVSAAPGQRIVLSMADTLNGWVPAVTNMMFNRQFTFEDVSSHSTRFYRAEVH
jgi:hypothetical protein